MGGEQIEGDPGKELAAIRKCGESHRVMKRVCSYAPNLVKTREVTPLNNSPRGPREGGCSQILCHPARDHRRGRDDFLGLMSDSTILSVSSPPRGSFSSGRGRKEEKGRLSEDDPPALDVFHFYA